MKKILFALFLSFIFIANSQYNPLQSPNTFRSLSNPNYWKNKLPHEGYWQQDVHYQIKANIDERTHIINGELELTYWNNSPDDLSFVYFHLYQNAFQPGSYYEDLQKNNGYKPQFGYYERQQKGTDIDFVKVNGKEQKITIDNTIMRVDLDQVIKSGESITFSINFKTYFDRGTMRRRMGIFIAENGMPHYNGVHWYPRISVYDRKFGWTTDQHLDKEFYGDFGCWDVELTFADNYVVDATGFLTNREEVLPKELRDKLDIKNFAEKKAPGTPISEITPYDPEKRKTWKFHAENVHDFAFTADPTYRIGEAEWNGIKCIALAREANAHRWQNAAEYTAKIIKTYSEDIGMYTYHKMIVADAEDGMEYPMLTLDSGGDPGYRGLLCHEIGHNWFFGQVGNNETYRASLDEGFTQFLTAWSLMAIDGDTLISTIPNTKSNYYNRHKKPDLALESRVYGGYYRGAFEADLPPLNTHSSDFNSAVRQGGGYGQVYSKTATMLYNLQYVLGEELFLAAMQNYFDEWKIAHPYWNDFRNSVIHFTKVDLNWFFDQWLETQKVIDYSVKCIKKNETKNGFAVTFERIGEMQMPIEFRVYYKDGTHQDYYIPNTWFTKDIDAIVLDKWYGWGKIQPTYTANIVTDKIIENVEIDPSKRLADINMLNNSSKLPLETNFDHQIYNSSNRTKYELFYRPDIWYNAYDGLKFGIHVNGNYLNKFHQISATAWMNSGLLQNVDQEITDINLYDNFSYRFSYSSPFKRLHRRSRIEVSAKHLDGLHAGKVGISYTSREQNNTIRIYGKAMYRENATDLTYLINPNTWSTGMLNSSLNIEYNHTYEYYRGYGGIDFRLRTPGLFSDYDFSYLQFETNNKTYLSKLIIKTRLFAQIGTGNNIPLESALGLSGANSEDMMDNKYMRSAGFIPSSFGGFGATTGNFQYGGGLNLRGYAGYLSPTETNSSTHFGNSGWAINTEIEFDRFLPSFPRKIKNVLNVNSYFFGDIGMINTNLISESLAFEQLRADAGVGAALTIKKFWILNKVKPLTVRFDVPFFLNRTPAIDGPNTFVNFNRWLIGINRAF